MAVLSHLQRSARLGQSWAVGVHEIPGVRVTPRNGNGRRPPPITAGGGPFPHTIPGGGSPSNIDWGGGVQGGLGGLSGGGPTGNPWVDAAAGFVGGLFQGDGDEAPGDQLVPGGGGAGPCPQGTFRLPGTQKCIDLIPGGSTQGGGMVVGGGDPVLGMHGVAMVPAFEERVVRRCIPGMVLGRDGLCYNKSQLRKSDRAHPPARKPLMTGGDLNAISRAARVAGRLKRKNRELKKLGLLK